MKNEVKSSETVTISKAEYESLKSHCAQLESELNWLKEQLLINKKKTFGSSSERMEDLYAISTEQTPISNCGKATLISPPSTSRSSSD